MASELIKLKDGLLIEIDKSGEEIESISGGNASSVEGSVEKVKEVIQKFLSPIHDTFNELNKEMNIEKAELSIGLGFEASGNIFIAKGTTKTNINIKIIMSPKSE